MHVCTCMYVHACMHVAEHSVTSDELRQKWRASLSEFLSCTYVLAYMCVVEHSVTKMKLNIEENNNNKQQIIKEAISNWLF